MELDQDCMVDFLLQSGGRASTWALLDHFKPLIQQDPQDSQGSASVRDAFRKCVDSVAEVRVQDGVRYVSLRERFRHPVTEKRTGSDAGESFQETCASTSPGDDATSSGDDAAAPGSNFGSDVQVCVPHVFPRVPEAVCEDQMGNRESSRHLDRGSRKNPPDMPAITLIQASPLPAGGTVFHLPGPAQTGTAPPANSACRLTCGGRAAADLGKEAADGREEVHLRSEVHLRNEVHLRDEDSPQGSRRHFLQVMMSSSPQVRRSVALRNWDPDYLRNEDASDSASVASSAEDERAAVTLDPAEHEWMMCASDGEWRSLQHLLERDPGLVLKKDFVTGFTCLHWAAKHGKPKLLALIVNFARQRGVTVDVDVRTSAGYTPLHLAAMQRHLEVVKLLVGAYSADVEARDYSGRKACQYLTDSVSGDIRDIVGACQASAERPEAPGDEGGRWRFSRVLQANLKPLRMLQAADSVDSADAAVAPPPRRRASLSKLQKLRHRTSQLVHSATFHGRDDLQASGRASSRFRPKTNFFG